MSYRYPDTPPPLPGAPTFIPSSWMRPSVLRPPRTEKKLLIVDAPPPASGGLNRRNGRDVVAIASRRRKRADDVSVDDGLLACGLDVHHRRLAGHGDGLLECPHSHVRANRHDATARQLNTFAHDSGEAGQREGDLVGAGWQIGNAILPRFVGDAGADFGDERRARRFNRHTREHGTRGVAHGSGEALRARQAGSRAEDSYHHQQSDQYSIHERETSWMPRLRGLSPLRPRVSRRRLSWLHNHVTLVMAKREHHAIRARIGNESYGATAAFVLRQVHEETSVRGLESSRT